MALAIENAIANLEKKPATGTTEDPSEPPTDTDKPSGDQTGTAVYSRKRMLMYGKEASNRKQEIDRQHYTIPNQRPKDKHCGKI